MKREEYSYAKEGNYSFFGEFTGGVVPGIGVGATWNTLAKYTSLVETALVNGTSTYISDIFTSVEGIPIYLTDGAVGSPGLAWQNDRTSVLYRLGSKNFGWSVDGDLVFDWNATRLRLDSGFSLDITDMTLGSVLFAGTGGRVSQDNSNFFWDDTNNRLGILTSSPTVALDVNGDIRDRNMTAGSVLFAGTSGVISQDNSNFFWDDLNNRLGIGVNTGLFRPLEVRHASTSQLVLSSSASKGVMMTGAGLGLSVEHYTDLGVAPIFDFIGDENDLTKLRVVNNDTGSAAAAAFQVQTQGSGDAMVQWGLVGGQSYSAGIDNSDSDNWKFAVGAALGTNDVITITSTGLVTFTSTAGNQVTIAYDGSNSATIAASAAGELQLNSTSNSTLISDTVTINGVEAGQGAALTLSPTAMSSGSKHVLALNGAANTGGSIGLINAVGGSATGQTAGTEIAMFRFFPGTITWATGAIANERCFEIFAPTLAFAGASTVTNAATLYIDNAPQAGSLATITNPYALWVDAGTVRFDGNVGIGTTGPDRPLDVLSTAGPQFRMTYTDGSVYTDFQTDSSGGFICAPTGPYAGWSSAVSAANWEFYTGNDSATAGSSAKITIYTNGTTGDSWLTCTDFTTPWSSGLDVSDSNKYKVSQSATLGTNDYLVIKTTGVCEHSSDVTILNSAKGLVLKDTAGTPHYWRVTVSAAGALTTTDLGTSPP